MKRKKKTGPFKLILAILIIIVIILLIKEYSQIYKLENLMPEKKPTKKFSNETGEKIEKPDIIKRIFGGGWGDGDSGGSGSSGGGSGYGGSSSGGTTPIYTTDLAICTNAQDGNLCNGLDLAYGDGYNSACCSERSLCC